MIFLSILMGTLTLLWFLDGLRLRQRASQFQILKPSDATPHADFHVITRSGAPLDEASKRAAIAYASKEDLQALVVVPEHLAAADAFLNVQSFDAKSFRKNRIGSAKIIGEAFIVRKDLLTRMERDFRSPRTQVEFAKMAKAFKDYATTSMDLVIAPGLKSTLDSQHVGMDPGLFQLMFGGAGSAVMVVQLALVGLGFFYAPWFALLALLVFMLQPFLVLIGSAFKVKGLLAYALLRPFLDLRTVVLCLFQKEDGVVKGVDPIAKERIEYRALLSEGTARFFEPVRKDCPMCGDQNLEKIVSTADRFQFKPGIFTIDRCVACDHKFQNPRLSIEGLNFYYKDFYDGLGEKQLDGIFGHNSKPYLARAQMLVGEAEPSRWLDVGGGHGHFCSLARDVWPTVPFDALDLSSSVMEAQKKGWSDRSYRGLFPDLADSIKKDYDVISMSHYLEHTRDPAAEIEAAAKILPEGGHLLIELPDPDCKFGKIFGSFWLPWFQPQHQHFLSAANLEHLLKVNNFVPVKWHRGEAHQPIDLLFSFGLFVHMIARPLDMPWLKPTSTLGRIWNRFVYVVSIPLLVIGRMLDFALAPLFRRPGWSNCYRVLARRVA